MGGEGEERMSGRRGRGEDEWEERERRGWEGGESGTGDRIEE